MGKNNFIKRANQTVAEAGEARKDLKEKIKDTIQDKLTKKEKPTKTLPKEFKMPNPKSLMKKNRIINEIKNKINEAKDVKNEIVQNITDRIQNRTAEYQNGENKIADAIKNRINITVDEIRSRISNFKNKAENEEMDLEDRINQIADKVQEARKNITNVRQTIVQKAISKAKSILTDRENDESAAIKKIQNFFSKKESILEGQISGLRDQVNNLKESTVNGAAQIAENLINSINATHIERHNRVKNVIQEKKNAIENSIEKFKNERKTKDQDAINRKRAAANKLRNMVERKVNQTIAVIRKSEVKFKIKEWNLTTKINMIKGNLRKNFMKKVPEIKQRLEEENLKKKDPELEET